MCIFASKVRRNFYEEYDGRYVPLSSLWAPEAYIQVVAWCTLALWKSSNVRVYTKPVPRGQLLQPLLHSSGDCTHTVLSYSFFWFGIGYEWNKGLHTFEVFKCIVKLFCPSFFGQLQKLSRFWNNREIRELQLYFARWQLHSSIFI